MAHYFGSDLQINGNQLLNARLELSNGLPTGTKGGRFVYITQLTPLPYDGVDLADHVGVASVEGADAVDEYRFLTGLNRNEVIVGKWIFAPSQTGSTTVGLNTLPPAPSGSGTEGTYPPFSVSGQSSTASGFGVTPDHDGAGDYVQPTAAPFLKRYLPNWVQHLHADLVDGYHATLAVTGYAIPVRVSGGHLRVPLDPTDLDHATSKQYVDNSRGGIRVRTAVAYKTTAALPAYTYSSGTRTLTASANGALSVDGSAVQAGDRIIVGSETDATANCVATVTQAGSAGTPWILRHVYGTTGGENPDPDGLGDYDYGDYFAVNGGSTLAGSTWVMSGTPTGGGGQAGPGDEIYFNLFQLSQPIQSGRGITISSARVHFWKASYAGSEINTFPYLKADVNGSGGIGTMGLYGTTPTYALKSSNANRLPKTATDAGAVFQDSLLVDDGTGFYPNSTIELGLTTKPWSKLWLTVTAAGAKLDYVTGTLGGTTQLQHRSWANFLTDLTGEAIFAPSARTLTLSSPASQITFATTEGGSYSASLTLSLASDRTWWVKLPQSLHTTATPTFASLYLTDVAANSKLSGVYGKNTGTDELKIRTWANFLTDLNTDLGTATFALKATTLTLTAGTGISITGGTQDLSANRTWTISASAIPSTTVTLTANAVGYGNASNQLTGSASALYFNGTNLGVGVTATEKFHVSGNSRIDGRLALGTSATPSHWLDLGGGTTTVAPIRFSGTNSLLSATTAGALMTDLGPSTPNARLYWTDGNPTRHVIAHTDDTNITNDPVLQGGVATLGTTYIESTVTEDIGTGPFTVWVRYKVPTSQAPAASFPGIFALRHPTTSPRNEFSMTYLAQSNTINVAMIVADSQIGSLNVPGAAIDVAGGKVVDLVLTRSGSTLTAYVNGIQSATNTDADWATSLSGWTRWLVGNYHPASGYALHQPVYRFSVFNRVLSASEIGNLGRYGIDPADMWGMGRELLTNGDFSSSSGWTINQPSSGTITISGGQLNFSSVSGAIAYAGQVLTSSDITAAGGFKGKRVRVAVTSVSGPTGGVLGFTSGSSGLTMSVNGTGAFTTEGIHTATALADSPFIFTVSGTVTATLDDASYKKIGALIDLDLGVGTGAVIPDRSGRYPATITGSLYQHTIPVYVSSGTGLFSAVRKYVAAINAKDNDTVDVVHNLNTQAVAVTVWNGTHQKIDVGMTRKSGNESNAVSLGFGLFGAPSATQAFTVVVTG